jgi:hypothetical protein
VCAGVDYNVNVHLGAVGLGTPNVADCTGYCYANFPAAVGGVLLTDSNNWCVCKGPVTGTPSPVAGENL